MSYIMIADFLPRHTEYSCIDEGLQKTGSTMSQIPTYVTAVPNGTEKVGPNEPMRYSRTDREL